MTSQNATFVGSVEPDPELDHPAGLPVVRALLGHLARLDWATGDFDDWRDCGWSVICQRGSSEVELVVAPIGAGDEWMLQVSPARVPGLLGRALGRTASASAETIHALAVDVHGYLSERFTRIRWRWDGFPEEATSTPEPAPPSGSRGPAA